MAAIGAGGSFYVERPAGDRVGIIVAGDASPRARPYLKTVADGDWPNNLLALPECPPTVDKFMGQPWLAPGIPPPHQPMNGTPHVALMTMGELWHRIDRADSGHRVLVSLRKPALRRGFFRGESLISETAFVTARDRILETIAGVRLDSAADAREIVLADGKRMPVFAAVVDSPAALAALAASESVDFVEPGLTLFDSLACGADSYAPSSDPRAQDERLFGAPPTWDLVPYVYRMHGVQDTWTRFQLPGDQQGIAVLDSGVSGAQNQFFDRYSLFHARRPHLRVNRTAETMEDACFHGTKVASIAAAPRDGRSVVGIAWNAPLTTVKVAHSPLNIGNRRVGAICDGINDAISPPDGRPPARVVAMALGLDYFSPTVAACIESAYNSSPSTIFVAAAGSNVSTVTFPGNFEPFVLAVSLVELTPGGSGFRLMGRPGTVAYGPEVDFVSPMTTGGIPSSGLVGDITRDEIARFRWSSAATGVYAGIVAVVGQWATRQGWSRDQLISALHLSASRDHITDFGGEPPEAVIGSGIVDLYRASGGIRQVDIGGPLQVGVEETFTLAVETDEIVPPGAEPSGDLTYRWSVNGASAGSGRMMTWRASGQGPLNVIVDVFDTLAQKSRRATRQVSVVSTSPPPPTTRTLFWVSYVADWATFFNGGRHNRLVNAGVLMPKGCSVENVRGLLMCDSGGVVAPCPGETPQVSINRGSKGFTISRPSGIPANSLEANVHQWHDGFSEVRTKTVYTVSQPASVNCDVPGVLDPTQSEWIPVGHATNVVAMAAVNGKLFAATRDNVLWARDPVLSDVNWQRIGHSNNVVAMAAANGMLFAATQDNVLWARDPVLSDVNWQRIGHANNVVAMAATNGKLFAATRDNALWARDPS